MNPVEPYWRTEVPLTVTVTATDDLSGVASVGLWYRYSPDNESWLGWVLHGEEGENWCWSFDPPEGDGYYEFYTIALDRAGNVEPAPENADARAAVDTIPPVSTVNPVGPYWQNASMVPFGITATASDPIPPNGAVPSGLKRVELYYRYSPDNVRWGDWVCYGIDEDEPWYWTFDAPEGDGYYEFYTVATDIALNAEAAPERADLNLGVDTKPPVSSVDPIEPYWQESVPFKVSATASDTLSGVAEVRLYYRSSIDNLSWGEWKPYGTDSAAPYEWSFTAPDGCALYEFCSVAADVAGNVENLPDAADAACGVVIPATVDIDPDTLNLKSKGRWITAYIELPSGYDLASVNVGAVALEGAVPAEPRPTEIGDQDGDGVPDLMVKFDRSAVQAVLQPAEEVELTITGSWHAVRFEGIDTIRVIDRGQGSRPEVPPGQPGGHLGNKPEQHPGQGDQGQGSPSTPQGQGGRSPGQGNQGGQGNSGGDQGNQGQGGKQGKGKEKSG